VLVRAAVVVDHPRVTGPRRPAGERGVGGVVGEGAVPYQLRVQAGIGGAVVVLEDDAVHRVGEVGAVSAEVDSGGVVRFYGPSDAGGGESAGDVDHGREWDAGESGHARSLGVRGEPVQEKAVRMPAPRRPVESTLTRKVSVNINAHFLRVNR
jgi:hypothetical protein